MTSKLEVLNEFHENLLVDVGVFDNDGEGLLSYLNKGVAKPVTLNGTRLCFPTLAHIRAGDWSALTAFHPLAEQISEGPSPVLNAFKNYVVERIKETVKKLGMELMKLAADPSRHKLPTAAGKFLKTVVDADDKTVNDLRKVFDAIGAAPEKHLVTIFLKNKTEDGSLRAAHVSFPFMDDANSDDKNTFFGIKMSRKIKDKERIVALLDYILGDEEERKQYTSGSKNTNSPYFHSLLLAFRKLATRLQGLIELHSSSCPDLVGFEFGLKWTDVVDDFTDFAKKYGVAVPALPGNTGNEIEEPSVYEAKGSDLGGVDDLPWDDTPEDKARRLGRDDDRSSRREESRPSRPSARDDRDDRRPADSGKRRSIKDLLNGRDRDRDDDRRGGRDRDRNDRSGGRDRDRGRGGRGSSW